MRLWSVAILFVCGLGVSSADGQSAPSLRQLARCWDAWATHTPRMVRYDPCAGQAELNVLCTPDQASVRDAAIDQLDRCLSRAGQPSLFVTPAGSCDSDTGCSEYFVRPVAPEIARHVAACLRARARSTRPDLDASACRAIANYDAYPPVTSQLEPGVELRAYGRAAAVRDVAQRALGSIEACRAAEPFASITLFVTIDAPRVQAATVPIDTPSPAASACVIAAIEAAGPPPHAHPSMGTLHLSFTAPPPSTTPHG